VGLELRRTNFDAPLPRDAIASLAPGRSDLEDCLARLGAPLYVEEQEEGAVLGWGWYRDRATGLRVSVPITRWFSASVDYDLGDDAVRGLLLFFDGDWRLTALREGSLAELASLEARRRPNLVEPAGGG